MARQPTQPASAPKKKMAAAEIRQGIDRIQKRLDEVAAFNVDNLREEFPPELKALSTAVSRSLEKTFGEDTNDYKRFALAANLQWFPGFFIAGQHTPLSDYRNGIANNIRRSKALLAEAIRTLEEDLEETAGAQPSKDDEKASPQKAHYKQVFVVHGRDEGAREMVARFLEQIDLHPVILHERPNKGRTIIAKLREEADDVGFAVVLLTPDDHGGIAGKETSLRARQNVVFELGFFIGALGPDRVAAMTRGEVEKPSDFDGVVYIPLQADWKMQLVRELIAAGYHVDWNKVMR